MYGGTLSVKPHPHTPDLQPVLLPRHLEVDLAEDRAPINAVLNQHSREEVGAARRVRLEHPRQRRLALRLVALRSVALGVQALRPSMALYARRDVPTCRSSESQMR